MRRNLYQVLAFPPIHPSLEQVSNGIFTLTSCFDEDSCAWYILQVFFLFKKKDKKNKKQKLTATVRAAVLAT